MKRLISTVGLSREEWLGWRRMGIGGSDVSVIAGVNPYRSIYELWEDKMGLRNPEEIENEYIHFGNVLEPVVKAEFTRRTGLKIRNKRVILQSDQYPFMLADLDGTINENGEMVIFEAKTATEYKKDVWQKGVPEEYMYQIQHYMAVTEAKKTYIAALVGGNSFIYHEVYRDENMIQEIIKMEERFWKENVLKGIEPEADGSKATTDFLNQKYKKSSGKEIELPKETMELIASYDAFSEQIKRLQKQKDKVANQIRNYMKDCEQGIIGDRRITWTPVETISIDKKRLQAEQKDIYEKYTTRSSNRRLNVA